MVDGMISIKEYAKLNSKSVQAVYKQMKSKENSNALKGHIHTLKINNKETKFLDADAVAILDDASRQAPTVIIQTEDKTLIEQLTMENKNLLLKVAELQEIIINKSEKIEKLQEANILLLEQNKDEEKPKGFFKKLFNK